MNRSRIVPGTPDHIAAAADILRRGRLVAFPTETVYGLGANALDSAAAARIFAAKGRPAFDPLIVHVPDAAAAMRLWTDVPPAAAELARRHWPGPLTLVLPKRGEIPDIVTSGLPTAAVRVPDHPVAAALLRAAGVPVAAPSANRFSRPSPTDAAAVESELGGAVDLILDGGPARVGVESSVVGWPDGTGRRPVLLRPGGIPLEQLREVLPDLVVRPRSRSDAGLDPTMAQPSPGLLERHYAPTTPMYLLTGPLPADAAFPLGRGGLLCLARSPVAAKFARVEELSPKGDTTEAAARLFAALRALDAAGLDWLVTERVPETGLGLAIMDRLRRASVGTAEVRSGTLEMREGPR